MYDVIIIGAGPGGIFSAYELMKQDENCLLYTSPSPRDTR